MLERGASYLSFSLWTFAALSLLACGDDGGASTGTGGSGAGGGAGGSGAIVGAGGGTMCTPGEAVACYSGPSGTEQVGVCTAGTATCNAQGTALGPCTGEVLPIVDDCVTPADEDCDGNAASCPGEHVWSKRFGDIEYQEGTSIATDGAGNVIVAGHFPSSVDFGGGPLTSAGNEEVFVAKFDAGGNHLWSKRFGDASDQEAFSVATDGAGNVLVAGYFVGTIDFGAGVLTSAGSSDIFVAKFDAAGQHLWSKSFGDAAAQHANSIATDDAGNVIFTGDMYGTVAFGGSPLTSAGLEDIFVLKLDADGNHLWSKIFGGTPREYGRSVTTDGADNIVVTGTTSYGAVDFGGGPFTGVGGDDVFVAKFTPSGNHIWSKTFGGTTDQKATSVATDDGGSVVVGGYFAGAVDFGGGVLTASGSSWDVFISKFDADGDHLWSKRFGDADSQYGNGIATDDAGNVVVTGYFNSDIDFGGGPLTSSGGSSIFVAELDLDGNHLWSKPFGDGGFQVGRAIATDPAGNVLVTGGCSGITDFGGGPLTAVGSPDVFIVKFAP